MSHMKILPNSTTEFSGIYTSRGNTKLGKSVGTINRMPGDTCPGESEWCSWACYAKGGMFFYQWKRYKTSNIELPEKFPPFVRIHASGDFDSEAYIDWISQMVKSNHETLFWAYTRSWRIPALLPALEALRGLPNMQLFASTDVTTELPPDGWRVAFIEGDTRFKGPLCMEQTGAKPSCASCGYCFKGFRNNIQFRQH